MMRQWFFKITHYAEQLLNDLDTLTGWPEAVKREFCNSIELTCKQCFKRTGLEDKKELTLIFLSHTKIEKQARLVLGS